jgi:hypothetical protein
VSLPAAGRVAGASSSKATCLSRRTVAIHLRGVRSAQVRRVTVSVNGARRKVLRGRRSSVRVTLARMPKTVAHVRVVVALRSGRRVVLKRTYRTCTAKGAHGTAGRAQATA